MVNISEAGLAIGNPLSERSAMLLGVPVAVVFLAVEAYPPSFSTMKTLSTVFQVSKATASIRERELMTLSNLNRRILAMAHKI
jgi:hypothetical protein